ncbi:MAG: hypothetical protein JNK65_03765 [Deltaproteobacteria bacterium]|nr:hypothetical protein [Deltaproteobacteria bacterium]
MNLKLPTSSHKIALSLSAFVLPGLGQLHLKRKKIGWFFIISSFASLILMFGKFMEGVFFAAEHHRFPRPPLLPILKILKEGFLYEKNAILGSLACLITIWILSIVDIYRNKNESSHW